MINANNYKDSSELTWEFVRKYGNTYVAPKEKGNWIFHFSPTPKKNWTYIETLGVWRCNVSAL